MVTTARDRQYVAPASPHPVFSSAVGGALCLDFVNTNGGRLPGRSDASPGPDFLDAVRSERLTSYEALLDWSSWIGALSPAAVAAMDTRARRQSREAERVLVRALRLREAIYRLGKAATEGWPAPAEDLAALNDEVSIARAHQQLAPPEGSSAPRRGGVHATEPYAWTWTSDDALDAMVWPVALSAAEVFTSDLVKRIGQCPAHGCGWLFLDTSRGGRRQWCDMAVCGNAEKVRRFREKQRQARRF